LGGVDPDHAARAVFALFLAMLPRESLFQDLRTLVVKVGTRVLCDDDNSLNGSRLAHLASEISALQDQGYSLVLVTSGAVGVGMGVLGYAQRPSEPAEKQACAAIGQIRLMQHYADCFHAHGKTVAQILLTGDDFRDQRRFNNVRHTVSTLLGKGVIPIVNENDTVTTEEIKVGDNDKLSADVAQFLEADLLVILSDEDGLYDKNPKDHADARRVDTVERITSDILHLAEEKPGSRVSVGGMRAKLVALRQITEAGTPAVLARGDRVRLQDLIKGAEVGTLFLPRATRIDRKRRWLAFVSRAKGQLLLDPGAVRALQNRRSSLLPAGVKKVRGVFEPGDFVELCDLDGDLIGRGRVAYSSRDVDRVKGRKSAEIAGILGVKGPGEIIHRDRLVVY
jgi:glutamate 5-kinase